MNRTASKVKLEFIVDSNDAKVHARLASLFNDMIDAAVRSCLVPGDVVNVRGRKWQWGVTKPLEPKPAKRGKRA